MAQRSAADAERLAALASYGILDTPPERGFDDIVRLARFSCRAPVALVSLVGKNRQWFKARSGFDPCQTPLEQSVCAHALNQTDLLVIPDLTLDPRTRANTLVTGEPHLRFYAGAPLVTLSGHVLGTLCVLDHVARPDGLTSAEEEALRALAHQVMSQLELRRALAERDRALVEKREGDRHHRLILDSAVDHAILSLDASGRITAWSRGAQALLGWREDEMLGGSAEPLFLPGDRAAGLPDADLSLARAQGHSLREGWRPRKDGSRFFASAETRPLVSETGAPNGWLVILRDLTSERRREHRLALLAEASAALLSAPVAGDVLRPILEAGADLIGLDECCMFDIAPDGCHLHLTHGIGLDPVTRERLARTAVEWPLCGIVAETAEPVILTGLLSDDDPRHAIARDMRFDNYAGFPILGQGRAKGVISFTRRAPEPFDGETLAFFATVARFLSVTRERIDAEESLRASERKWRELFEELQEGFVLGRLVRDGTGRAVDWRYEAVNRAWAELTGLSPEMALGRTVRELFPQLGPEWVRGVALAVQERKSVRFLRTVEAMGRTFEGVVQPSGDDGFTALFTEITDRVRAETRRDALAGLSELLLRGEDEAKLLHGAAEAVGRALHVASVAYRGVAADGSVTPSGPEWHRDGAPLAIDHGALASAPEALGRAVAVENSLALQPSDATRSRARAFVRHPVTEGGRVVALLEVADAQPRRWSAEELAFIAEAAARIRAAVERNRVEALLRDNERRLQTLIHTLPVGVLLAEAKTGRVIAGNRRMDAILGRPAASVLAPGGDHLFLAFDGEGNRIDPSHCPLPRILRGQAERATLEMQLQRPDGSRVWIEVVGEAIRDASGRLRGAVLCASEIEDRKRTEAQQRILARELSHRLKNTLAVVQSIATQTLRSASDVESARGTLTQRIQALSHAHEILLIGQHDAGSLEAIVRGAVKVHEPGGRIALEGPQVLIGSRAALALALIANELSTNAVKYGALSVPEGRVEIQWSLREDEPGGQPILDFRWTETGGPPVAAPTRKGFGTRLVGMGLTGAPGGAVDLAYDPGGLRCRITAPLNDLILDEET